MHSRKEDAESGKRRGMSDYGGRQAVACHVHSVSTGCESEFYTPPEYLFTFYSVPVIKCSAQINKGQRVHSAAHSQGTVHHGVETRTLKLEAGGHITATSRKRRVMTSWRCSAPSHHWHSTRCHAGSWGHHGGWGFSPEWMTSRQAYPSTPRGPSSRWLRIFEWTWQQLTNNHTFLLKMKEKWRPFQMKMETLHSQKKWLKGKNVRWSIGPTWETSSSQRMGGFRRWHVNQVCNPALWKVREEDVYKPTVSWATQELEVSLTFS